MGCCLQRENLPLTDLFNSKRIYQHKISKFRNNCPSGGVLLDPHFVKLGRRESDFNCFVALSTPDRNRVKNCVVPCWCCVVLVLSSERHAELCCCALHIGNGLHGICIKIKKEQSQQYHSNTSSHLFRYTEYFSSTIFECYRFHRLSCCGKLSIGRLSALRDLICFLKEKIFSF